MDNNLENKLVDAWCDLNDPVKSLVLQDSINTKRASFSLSANGNTPAVNGSCILGGTDYKEKEKVLKSVLSKGDPSELTEEEYAIALREFKNNPLTGCTSILDMARVASGYDPNGNVSDKKNTEKFNDYLKRVLAAPFYHLSMNDHSHYSRSESSWSEAITAISDLFIGVMGEDKVKITTSIKNLAVAVASKKDTRQTNDLFAVSAINAPYDKNIIEVFLYSSRIEMIESTAKGSDSKQTEIEIRKITLKFNIEMWQTYARKVLDKHVKLVDEWLDDNTTHPGDIKVKLCTGPYVSM